MDTSYKKPSRFVPEGEQKVILEEYASSLCKDVNFGAMSAVELEAFIKSSLTTAVMSVKSRYGTSTDSDVRECLGAISAALDSAKSDVGM